MDDNRQQHHHNDIDSSYKRVCEDLKNYELDTNELGVVLEDEVEFFLT